MLKILLVVTGIIWIPLMGIAQGAEPAAGVAKITLLPGWRTSNGNHMAGLRITLAEGWKTYWRAPGDAGIPPQFDWEGSSNLTKVTIHWPTPKVFYQNGLRTVGYSGDTVIPIEFSPTKPGDITLVGNIALGVCEDICVPMSAVISGNLLPGGSPDKQIRASLKNQPTPAAKAGVKHTTCSIVPIADGLRLNAQITMPNQGGQEVAVVELPDQTIWISEATSKRSGGVLSVEVDMVPPNGAPFMLNRSQVRVTVLGQNAAVNIQGCTAG